MMFLKIALATMASFHIDGIPRAFDLQSQEKEFWEFAKANPDIVWVQKQNSNRGVKIVSLADIQENFPSDSFVQEYIGNPLLINRR